MTQQNKTGGQTAPETDKIPANLPLEFIPLYDWWKKDGKRFLVTLAVCAMVVAVVWGGRSYWAAHQQAANQAILQAQTPEELEQVIAQNHYFKIGNAARLRLAKAYFDAGRYDDAMAAYDACIAKGAPDGFAEITELGRASTFEAMKKFDEAIKTYQAFHAAHPKHFLAFQAKLGIARCLAMQGKKDEALKNLETLKAESTGNPQKEAQANQTELLIKRYEPRAERSLFDQAEAAAKLVGSVTNRVSTPKGVVFPAPAAKKSAPAHKVPAPKK